MSASDERAARTQRSEGRRRGEERMQVWRAPGGQQVDMGRGRSRRGEGRRRAHGEHKRAGRAHRRGHGRRGWAERGACGGRECRSAAML